MILFLHAALFVQESNKITEKRLKWYGHVRRMKEEQKRSTGYQKETDGRHWTLMKYQWIYKGQLRAHNYKVCKSKVNTQMGGGKWFDTKAGVRQGSILSPLLVILFKYMDLVIKEVHGINDNDKQFILA